MEQRELRARLLRLEAEVAQLRLTLDLPVEPPVPPTLSRREKLLVEAERVAHFGSWTWNLRSGELAWSDEFFRILGLDSKLVLPSPAAFFAAAHPEDRPNVEDAYQRALSRGETEPFDFRIVRPDGEIREVRTEAALVDGAEGPRSHLVGTFIDVTEKRRAAALLAQMVSDLSEAHLIAGLGSWRWHLPDGCVEWSESMFRLLGLDTSATPSEELFFCHVHPDDIARTRAASVHAVETAIPSQLELRIVRSDGTVRDTVLYSRASCDEAGRLNGFHGVIQDITERKALEDAARHAQKMDAVGTLAGGVAHDFNNYLMVLGGHVELLSMSLPTGHPAHASLEAIQFAYGRCAQLTEQLLTLSRKRPPKLCRFDLAEQLETLAPMLRSVLGATITLELKLDRNAPPVYADPAQVEHAVMNLTLNARDGMRAGGTLTLSIEGVCVEPRPEAHLDAGYYIRLSVTDTGCGIPAELLSRIFEPFFTTKAVGKGTGLGLAVVYGIVRNAGGGIEVTSQVGQGTTFHLYFRPAKGSETQVHAPLVAIGVAGNGQRILLVEDVELVRELLRNQLTQAGYDVLTAPDGKAALAVLATHTVDAVLSDVVMPHMGGVELVRAVQNQYAHLPCLLMSGYSAFTLADDGRELPVPLLRKPFTTRELCTALAELLRGSHKIGQALG